MRSLIVHKPSAPASPGAVSFFLVACLVLGACSLVPDPRPSDRVTVASWNVQNLFDEVDDGGEYPEFDPDRGWSRADFWGRCSALAPVIRSLADGGPDILVLQEVEGAHALEVLNTRFLPDLGYRHWFLAPGQVEGVKTAVLSRYPPVRTGLLYPSGEDGEPQRPLVEAEFDLGGRALVILGNHWKSRIPSAGSTEALRRQSSLVLARRLAALDTRPDRPLVAALGDFNTSLELSRPWPGRALVSGGTADPDEPALTVFSGRADAEASGRPGAVWEPWETVSEPRGSYLYQKEWSRLDHAFVTALSLGLPDWTFGSFRVAAYAPQPLPYGVRTPRGVSDHFPVVLTLVRR